MVCYDSHEFMLALLVVYSRTSIEGDSVFSFPLVTRESEVYR